jgi:hypothetical protein
MIPMRKIRKNVVVDSRPKPMKIDVSKTRVELVFWKC